MSHNSFFLSQKKIKFLFWYFGFILIVGFFLTLFSINYKLYDININITLASLVGGIGTALLGASIFYMRKLYKSSIGSLLQEPNSDDDKKKETGLYFYYFLRPIFATIFSVIIHIGLKTSVAIVTVKESSLEEGFIYLTMLISFFIGFASGDVITKIESISKEFTDKTIDKIS